MEGRSPSAIRDAVPPSVGTSEIERACAVAPEAPAPAAALALDVLSRQAEARVLFAGEDYIEKKRAHHGVDPDTEVGGEKIVALLERGPRAGSEYALVAALAAQGLREHLDDEERLRRFARHADWLALATPYPAHEVIDAVLEEDAGAVWDAVADGLQKPGRDGYTARDEALDALRRGALARARHPRAAERLAEAGGAKVPSGTELSGALERPTPTGALGLLRLVSGFAALQWIFRGLGFALGVRRDGALRVERSGLRLRSQVRLLGRTVRSREETFAWPAVASVACSTRFVAMPHLVGAFLFALGVVIGGVWIFDGVRSGETVLLGLGAVAILVGGGLDYAITNAWPSARGRVAVELGVLPKRRLRLARVAEREAVAFVDALSAAHARG